MDTKSYQYNQIEAALVDAFNIQPEALPKFRARLRHLRKQGIPNLPPVGRGAILSYSAFHLAELAFALELEAIGIPPARTPRIVENARRRLDVLLPLNDAARGGNTALWFVIAPDLISDRLWHKSYLASSKEALAKSMKEMQHKFGRVIATDLGARINSAFAAIEGTTPAKRGP